MLALFAIGAVGFWIFFTIAFIALMFFVQFEKTGLALLTVILTGAMVYFANDSVVPWVTTNALLLGELAVGYVVIGVVWAVAKWFLFVTDRKELLTEYRDGWYASMAQISQDTREPFIPTNEAFRQHFNENKTRTIYLRGEHLSLQNDLGMPEPRKFKGRIANWMGWWPWSLLNAILFDFFKRLFQRLTLALTGFLRSIAAKVYGEDFADLK